MNVPENVQLEGVRGDQIVSLETWEVDDDEDDCHEADGDER
ncbi:hypothetical protein [Haloarcula sp. CGMCC 1.6347]